MNKNNFTLRVIDCPLCGSSRFTAMLRGMKFDFKNNCWAVHETIQVGVCDHCGLVYENPQVVLEENALYTDQHCYTPKADLISHDKHQQRMNHMLWGLLEQRLNWKGFNRALDIGASGAWSDFILQKHPHIEQVVLEPSWDAVQHGRKCYPKVDIRHGIFETFEDSPGSYGLISLFNAIYVLAKPRKALANIHQLLTDDGRLIINVTNQHLHVEAWLYGRPYLNLAQLMRTIMLVYYSRKTLKIMLKISGFEIIEDFTAEQPEDPLVIYMRRNQWYFVIARKSAHGIPKMDFEDLKDETERLEAENFFKRYCEMISDISIQALFDRHLANHIHLFIPDNPHYIEWLLPRLKAHCPNVIVYSKPLDHTELELADEPGTILLNGFEADVDIEPLHRRFDHIKAFNCRIPPETPSNDPFNLCIHNENGEMIITHSFCPIQDIRLFPFPAQELVRG